MSQFKWLISNDYLHLWRNGKLSANKALKLTGFGTQLIAMLDWMYVASNYILSDHLWVKQHSRKVSTAECTRQTGTATTWAHLTSYIPTAAECIPNLILPPNMMHLFSDDSENCKNHNYSDIFKSTEGHFMKKWLISENTSCQQFFRLDWDVAIVTLSNFITITVQVL